MNHTVHNKLVSFIWSIADDCLRDVYVRGKYQEDAYLGTIVTRTNLITAINTLPASVSLSLSPNPVKDRVVHLRVSVNEVLKSTYTIYQSNGQYISGGFVQLLPGTNYYSIALPPSVSEGIYHIVISNKKWMTAKTLVVL